MTLQKRFTFVVPNEQCCDFDVGGVGVVRVGVVGVAGLRALDLFCGGGGVALGLMRVGFEVVGVDHDDRCRGVYPGKFLLGDALDPPVDLSDFDFVWASPPCQRYSTATPAMHREKHPDLIPPTRELLAGHPYTAIENVPGSPIRKDIVLTGPMVGLDRIQRKRYFECSFWPGLLPPVVHLDPSVMASGKGVSISTSMSNACHFYPRKKIGLSGRVGVVEAREVMGITIPMTVRQVGEAIPPAYAEFVARRALWAMGR